MREYGATLSSRNRAPNLERTMQQLIVGPRGTLKATQNSREMRFGLIRSELL